MNNLAKRIARLEDNLGKPEPRDLTRDVLITNVDFMGGVMLFPGLWAHGFGGPFTSEEIQKLREENQAGYEQI